MKRTGIAIAAALALAGAGFAGTAYATGQPSPTPCSGACAAASAAASSGAVATSLSDTAAHALAYTREEERLARDLYQLFSDTYDGARPFSNIVTSEQRHFDAVGALLQRYEVEDPSAGRAAGSYAFPELQSHYDAWKTQGLASRQAAYEAALDLEKRDVAELTELAASDVPGDVAGVYGNLLKASRQHVRAYTAATQGTLPEPGQGQGMGPGKGMGQGQGMQRGPGAGHGHGESGAGRWSCLSGS